MAHWTNDLKYAVRRIGQAPGFAAIAIVSIGLGIGANSTIFSMVSRFVLRPATAGDPRSLMELQTTNRNGSYNTFSWPLFNDVKGSAKSFSSVAAYYELLAASVGGAGEPERIWGQAATTNFFDAAQLPMEKGRGFAPDEARATVVVLGYRTWRGRFASDPQIIGKKITLSGRPFTVVGVAPRDFRGLDLILDSQFWVPLGTLDELLPQTADWNSRDQHWLRAIGRLRPGVTVQDASAELEVLAKRFLAVRQNSNDDGWFAMEQAGSLPARQKKTVALFLTGLSIVVLLVLCIACANVANLLLAQAAARQREMGVRLALGATRGQLLRQLLTESVLLAVAGGLFGVAISFLATKGLTAFRFPAPVPLDLSVTVDWRVMLYTFALSVGTGLMFGVAPAWAAARPIIASALKGEATFGRPGRFWSLRNTLVVTQVATSMTLLCATGLFLRSLQSASSIDIGFRSRGVVMMAVDPRLHGYTPERTNQLLNELRRRTATLPGVVSAACTDNVLLSMGGRRDGLHVEGSATSGADPGVDLYMATPGYFATLGIPLVAGREFNEAEAVSTSRNARVTAVINESLAKKLFGKESPLGRRLSGGGETYEIVGVAKDTKSRTIGEQQALVLFRSLAQQVGRDDSFAGYSIVARTNGDEAAVAEAIRNEIHSLDPTMAVFSAETMEDHLRNALFLPRLAGTLFSVFGIVGLSLASIGLYGVMNYFVSRRIREIGIRMALGAETGEIQRMVLRRGMMLTAIAVSVGLGAAWVTARLANSFLYGVSPHDAITFVVVPFVLSSIALMACWIPSRRAARVSPLTALRYE